MNEAGNARLSGLRVLVPRPHPQGEELVARIQECGGEAVHFPVIEIHPPESYSDLDRIIFGLDRFALVVMVSSSAANAVTNRLTQLGRSIPDKTMVAAIGPKTAKELRKGGIYVDFQTSSRIDTEGLVQVLEEIDLDKKRVCIFRGQDGREDLKAALESRGGRVEYSTCYVRCVTRKPFDPIVALWGSGGIDATVITSSSILEAIVFLLGKENRPMLMETPVVTISERLENQCRDLGISCTIVCDPVTESMIDALASLARR